MVLSIAVFIAITYFTVITVILNEFLTLLFYLMVPYVFISLECPYVTLTVDLKL